MVAVTAMTAVSMSPNIKEFRVPANMTVMILRHYS